MNQLKQVSIFLILLTCMPILAYAETVYVIDKLYVSLRAEANDASATGRTVESGTALEVLERQDRFAHVRDKQGMEAWVEARYLTTEIPVREQMGKLQEELTKARAQAVEAQAQLKTIEATLAEQTAKSADLEKAAAEITPLVEPAIVTPLLEVPVKEVAANDPPVAPSSTNTGIVFNLVWLAVSFAMLGIGFAAGVVWLRESIRRRSGGMYLRI